jgi:hypothetical protein
MAVIPGFRNVMYWKGFCGAEIANAWLGNFGRLVVRYDRSLTICGAFSYRLLHDRLAEGCGIASRPKQLKPQNRACLTP